MEGRNIAPFPRQVLLGGSAGAVSWTSETFDIQEFKSLVWTFEVYASLPGAVSNPATLYLETSNDFNGPWVDLIPGGEDPNVGTVAAGAVEDAGRFLRARVSVFQGEAAMVAVRCVARVGRK